MQNTKAPVLAGCGRSSRDVGVGKAFNDTVLKYHGGGAKDKIGSPFNVAILVVLATVFSGYI